MKYSESEVLHIYFFQVACHAEQLQQGSRIWWRNRFGFVLYPLSYPKTFLSSDAAWAIWKIARPTICFYKVGQFGEKSNQRYLSGKRIDDSVLHPNTQPYGFWLDSPLKTYNSQYPFWVRKDILEYPSFSFGCLELKAFWGSYNKVSVSHINLIQILEAVIASIENVIRDWFIRNLTQRLAVMYRGGSDMEECR